MPAGKIASGVSEPARASIERWTVPSPPQTKSSSAPLCECTLHLLGREPALRHLDPHRICDPWRSSSRRSSGRPPPKDLPACATTATLVISQPPRGPRDENQHGHRGDPDDDAARDVERMVHSAIHAGEGDEYWDQDRDDPDRDLSRAVPDSRGQQQREPAVDGDGRSGMSRGIAGVHGQVLEAVHLRPVTVDHERRRAIRRRLDGEREEQEAGEPPVLRGDCDQRAHSGDDRQHDAARHDRADERGFRQAARAMAGQKADEALVVRRDAVDVEQHPRDDQSGDDRQRRNRDDCEQDAEHIRPHRMALAR